MNIWLARRGIRSVHLRKLRLWLHQIVQWPLPLARNVFWSARLWRSSLGSMAAFACHGVRGVAQENHRRFQASQVTVSPLPRGLETHSRSFRLSLHRGH